MAMYVILLNGVWTAVKTTSKSYAESMVAFFTDAFMKDKTRFNRLVLYEVKGNNWKSILDVNLDAMYDC